MCKLSHLEGEVCSRLVQYTIEQSDQTLPTHSDLALTGRISEWTRPTQDLGNVKITKAEHEISKGMGLCLSGIDGKGQNRLSLYSTFSRKASSDSLCVSVKPDLKTRDGYGGADVDTPGPAGENQVIKRPQSHHQPCSGICPYLCLPWQEGRRLHRQTQLTP